MIFSFGFIFSFLATTVAIIVGFLYILLPRFISFFIDSKFTHHIGIFVVTLQLNGGFRLRYFCERVLCIDIIQPQITIRKLPHRRAEQKQSVLSTPGSGDKNFDSYKWLIQSFGAIVAVRVEQFSMVFQENESCINLDHMSVSVLLSHEHENVFLITLHIESPRVFIAHRDKKIFLAAVKRATVENEVDLFSFNNHLPDKLCIFIDSPTIETSIDNIADMRKVIHDFRIGRQTTSTVSSKSWQKKMRQLPSRIFVSISSTRVVVREHSRSNLDRMISHASIPIDEQHVQLHCAVISCKCVLRCLAEIGEVIDVLFGVQKLDISLRAKHTEFQIFSANAVIESILSLLEKDVTSLAPNDIRVYLDECRLMFSSSEKILTFFTSARTNLITTSSQSSTKLPQIDAALTEDVEKKIPLACCSIVLTNCCVGIEADDESIELHCALSHLRHNPFVSAEKHERIAISLGDIRVIHVAETCSDIMTLFSAQAFASISITKKINVLMNIEMFILTINVPLTLLDFITTIKTRLLPLRSSDDVICATNHTHIQHTSSMLIQVHISVYEGDVCVSLIDRTQELYRYTCFRFEYLKCELLPTPNSCQYEFTNARVQCNTMRDVIQRDERQHLLCANANNGIVLPTLKISLTSSVILVHCNTINIDISLVFATSLCVMYMKFSAFKKQFESLPTHTTIHHTKDNNVRPIEFNAVTCVMNLHVNASNNVSAEFNTLSITSSRGFMALQGKFELNDHVDKQILHHQNLCVLTFNTFSVLRNSEKKSLIISLNTLRVEMAENFEFGNFYELFLYKWKAFQWFRAVDADRRKKFAVHPDKPRLPIGFDYTLFEIRIATLLLFFHEEYTERLYLVRRWIVLNSSQRHKHRRLAQLYQAETSDNWCLEHREKRLNNHTSRDSIVDDESSTPLEKLQSLHRSLRNSVSIEVDQFVLRLHSPSSVEEALRCVKARDSCPPESSPIQNDLCVFSNLWQMEVLIEVSKLLVLLRDYPFPLARATSSIIITGSLAQARLRAPKLFQKTRIVALPISWDGIRNIHTFVELSPYSSVATKYYIDIHLQGDALEINYGACQRGGITALSRAFSRLSSSRDVAVRNGFEESLDISTSSYGHSMQAGTPLVYWDMLRAIIHGNIRVNVLQMLFRVLSSASPYLSSFVEIRARKLALASTTRRVVVSANNLQIRLNDDSSSNDALHRPGLIFYSPNFRAIIRYQWASAHPTEDDALQHHVQHVHWQEADFKFSSPYRRDVFDVFRATKLSLACRVEIGPLKLVHHARLSTKTQESGSEKLPSRPVLSLWLNNIEWLTSVSRLFSKPPSSLRIRSKRAMRRSHKWRTPIPLSQSIGYLLRTIALKISCNHPVIEVLSERISEGIILGAQGKAKTLQFSSVLCVEDGAIENTSVWSWRRTRMSCQDFAVDLLVPSNFATTLADPEAEITSDRKTTESIPGSPFSSHSLAGPSQALFFVSATDLLYASPSAGGKSVDSSDKSPSVSESRSRSPCRPVLSASSHTISPNARLLSPSTALVVANEEFLWAQLGDNSTDSNTTATSHDKISLANVSSDHGAEMLVGKATTSPPSSPLLSTSRIPFARFSRSRSPDRFHEVHELGHEHYIRVCAVKLLWNNAIRIAFDAWWKFMAEFHHANASDSGSDNTVSHSHSSCDTNNDENVDDDNDTSSTHHSSIENDVVLPSLLQRSASTDLIRAFVDNEDSERNISASSRRSVKETDEINHEMFKQEQRKVHSLFLMQLEQPQINFQSTEVFSSVLVAAPDASVELSGFPFFLDDNEKICKSDVIDSESRAQRLREHCSTASYFSSTTEKHECSEFLYHKKRFDTRFNDAQLHVMLTDIDVDRNAMHWLPLHCFPQRKQTMDNVNDDDNDDDDDSVFKSQGVFQRITAPSTIKFEYVYDVNMDTVDERAFAFQRENCSTRASELCESAETKPRGSVDDTINQNFMCMRKHKDRYRFIRNALTSLTRLRIASIQMRMDSVQFGAVIDVVNFLVLAPVQEGWALAAACAREPVKISETKLLKSLDKALQMDAENKDQIVDTTVVRAIEYFVESGTCTMLTNSSEVHLRVRLQQLAGRHRYLLDGGRKLNIGLKQFDVFNMSDKALWPDVLTPHETWSVAKDTHQLMLLFRATIVGLPEQLPDLQNVTAWDHLEVNVFPLNIKALASHYTEIRNYFLPPIQETHPNDELMFSSSRFPRRKHGRSDTSRKRMSSSGSSEHRSSISSSQSRPSSVSVGDAESARPIPATQKTSSQALEYFKYVRLNELEFFVNYRGSYLDLDNLRVVIASFTCNHVLWDWNKFVSKLEQHVHRAVLGQTSSLLKQKFSRNVKSRGEKEHKIRDIFASTFNRMARAQQQYPMITASDDESFGEDERKRDIVCENRVLRARSVNDDDDDDDDDGEDDDDDDDGGGEDDDDGNDDDDSVTEQIVKPDSINS